MKRHEHLSDMHKWAHSVLGIICITFFFSLFSVGNGFEQSIALNIAAWCFGIGLPLNAGLAFLHGMFKSEKLLTQYAQKYLLFRLVEILALNLIFLGVVFLISHFSLSLSIVVFIFGLIAIFIFKKIILITAEDYLNQTDKDFVSWLESVHTEAGNSKEEIEALKADYYRHMKSKR